MGREGIGMKLPVIQNLALIFKSALKFNKWSGYLGQHFFIICFTGQIFKKLGRGGQKKIKIKVCLFPSL